MSEQESRQPRRFALDPEQLTQPPPAVTDIPDEATDSGFQTFETLSIDRPLVPTPLRRALISLTLLISVLLVADLSQLVNTLWQTHWILGASAGSILSALILYSLLGIRRWMKGGKGMSEMHRLQLQAEQLRRTNVRNDTSAFKQHLQSFYSGKVQESQLNSALETLPDYASDAETIEHLERVFIEPLDTRVDKIIQKYALQTGLSVAASPFPTLDILLTLWRCQIMITEVSSIYGIKPSLANRMRILYQVLRAMAYSGLTETSIGLADLSNIPLGQISARTAQGLGAAVAAARLGTVAAQLCRPIPAKDGNKRLFKKLTSAVLVLLGKRILR